MTAAAPRHPSPALRTTAAVLTLLSALLTALVAATWQPLTDTDRSVARRLHSAAVSEPGWTRANRVLTDWVWDPATMRLLILAVILWLLWRGARRLPLWLAGAVAVGWVLQYGMKAAVGRDRPKWSDPVDSASHAAFPSGHAMTVALVCGLLLWVLGRADGVPPGLRYAAWTAAAVSVAGVCFTRVWLGVHWLSDVVGGTLMGAAVAAITAVAYGARAPAAREDRVEVRG
ncbi:phosphatase PAP2 family protein [Streptomyces sp. WMMC500]|uniref:phosphatase PAP2 family protein n=1 Tax=Streptomyces sp. WMMC500 TaxID=3015154 RepID=UPI00248BD8AC|nr:phosphatase PAP2 family protein [Streptomyces sp. WMMC500]WBB60693.1 phosphatase PAP2 family protein [Streptomyces sp. WMMC500]